MCQTVRDWAPNPMRRCWAATQLPDLATKGIIMTLDRRRLLARFALVPVASLATLPGITQAQPASAGVTKIIVPYAPGAATDALARLLAQALEGALGGKVIVENRAGGGTQIGMKLLASAAPDGATLGFVDT